MNLLAEMAVMIGEVSNLLGKPIESTKYQIIDFGAPHKPQSLPSGTMGVYSFWHNGDCLKIGKAGKKSAARMLSQHYNPKSSQSNLAKSLLRDESLQTLCLTSANVGDWIKTNCRRIDIIIDADLGIFTLELIEAILHYKYEPLYEGFQTQRAKG